ncbi:MAG: strictosidine synthase family protein [Myxococcota bacterium]
MGTDRGYSKTRPRRGLRIALIGLGAVVLVAAILLVRTLHAANAFTSLEPVGSPSCSALRGVPGAEDLVIDRATDTVYVSSTDRHAVRSGEAHRGDLFAFSLDDPQGTLRNLTAHLVSELQPHGIDLHANADGTKSLMAVSHPGDGRHGVEIFRVDDADPFALSHVRTVEHGRLVSPNDVAAVGPDAFYATNDHTSPPSWWREVKDYLVWTDSNVVHWDGTDMRVVAEDLVFANGVALSQDGEEAYVAETLGNAIRIYDRDPANGHLTLRDTIDVGTGADNIDVDAEGHLWVGAHPKMLRFVEHAEDPSKRSPSQVLRVNVQTEEPQVETRWLDMGEELSGSSVAVVHQGKMLIGSVFEPHILICDRP